MSAHSVVVTVLAAVLLAGCSAGRAAEAADRPELPVSVTAQITSTTTTTTTTTSSTTIPSTTAVPATTRRPPSPPPSPPPSSAGRALVIGDSVLLAARSALPAALPDWSVTVDAAESRTIAAFAGVLAARGGAASYQAVAIHLCTNYSKGGGFGRALERAMAALAEVPRVVWVTCVEWSAGPPEANQVIRAAADRYGNVSIADWEVISAAPGYTYADGIHLRPDGQRAAAAAVASAIGRA